MDSRTNKLIYKFNQNDIAKKIEFPNGICILLAFYFGALEMHHMNVKTVMQEIVKLNSENEKTMISIFKDIYQIYRQGTGNFHAEVSTVAALYEQKQVFSNMKFKAYDYDSFNKDNPIKITQLFADDIKGHYVPLINDNRPQFLMIGFEIEEGLEHAISLIYTLENEIYIFDPNDGVFLIKNLDVFLDRYKAIKQLDMVLVGLELSDDNII